MTESQNQIRRAIQRAMIGLNPDERRVARLIEEASTHRRPINVKAIINNMQISYEKFYEIAGRAALEFLVEVEDLVDES